MVTHTVYSQCMPSYWLHTQYILSVCHPIGQAAEDKAAAEEEMRARKPTTLDEAVEKAISVRLTVEKARLAAEYTAR